MQNFLDGDRVLVNGRDESGVMHHNEVAIIIGGPTGPHWSDHVVVFIGGAEDGIHRMVASQHLTRFIFDPAPIHDPEALEAWLAQ